MVFKEEEWNKKLNSILLTKTQLQTKNINLK